MLKVICFDLEGPLSPQDNAYEITALIENGHKIFEVLSRYDDILTIEGREGYEPGDTLSLIVPFLLYHGISERDIRGVSDTAKIVDGVDYTVSKLKSLGWEIFVISTSYQQHAFNMGRRIRIPRDRIYCTKFPLDKYREEAMGIDFSLIEDVENDILKELYPNPDNSERTRKISFQEIFVPNQSSALIRVKRRLDKFFYKDILKTGIGKFMKGVKVIGGQRKVDAVYKISERTGVPLSRIVAVGDSITDYKMLNEVRSKGGLSIVFNGNEYAIPYANIGMASSDMRFILVLLNAYMQGGREKVIETVNFWEKEREKFSGNAGKIPEDIVSADIIDFIKKRSSNKNSSLPYFHCLENLNKEKQEEIIKIHKKFRALVRGDAAKLG